MQLTTFPLRLEKAVMITPKVKHFVFRCELTPAFRYEPGQFITIHFEHEGKALKRSYSIANAPTENNQIELAAGYFANGPGTELLFNLKEGDCLQASGPYGRLTLKSDLPKRYVLVATSTGITPYRAMLPELKKRLEAHPELQVLILQGVQHRADLLYPDDFQNFAKDNPRTQFRSCLSQEKSLQINESKGYVQHDFAARNLNPAEDVVYLCGNPGMIDDAFTQLKEQGFSLTQIIREKYISR